MTRSATPAPAVRHLVSQEYLAVPADASSRIPPTADDTADGTVDDAPHDAERVGAGRPLVVAIDGPAGSGKSSVARRVAQRLGMPHVDTGALYRAATLAVLRAEVDPDDEDACAAVVAAVDLQRRGDRTFLDGEDVEDEIRGDAVTAAVSAVSAHAAVRAALLPAQRHAVAEHGGVVEGRDIGSAVLPEADVKVFLTASVEERARRRGGQVGRDDLEVLAQEIAARDAADGGRAVSPMAVADDAWVLDSSDLDVEQVVDAVVDRVREVAGARPVDPLSARRALPRVAIVGRPNVGKSTLVNRILGARVAIVEEKPGVTRDRTEHPAEWLGRHFLVVDTGGWEHQAEGMAARIVEQAEAAVTDADLVLFVVDATVGALEDDERYARLLRRSGVPTLLVANKVDSNAQESLVHELYGLGLGAAHPVSARHGRGVGDLLDEVLAGLPEAAEVAPEADAVPRVAIVGKPNVGKSSLFNRLLGQERSIVDSVPHTTRDAVDTMVEVDGEPWVFVDTAGMRRRYRHGEETELYSVDRTRAAIQGADLVLFVIDASEPLGEQDQRLAALLREAGRGVVLVCNKWDLVDEDRRHELERELDRLLSFAAWAPRVNVSAASGRGLRRLLPQLRSVWGNYRRRVPTRELNRLVEDAVARHPLPRQGNRNLKIRYATQAEIAPPRFVLFANGALPPSYRRYLERELRQQHDFTGVPLLFEDRPPAPRNRR
ncbi:ribosome biogenesis GTPase Der [Egicoccus sp. AB-alg2]|uniref:ribosome biogenesis GTPase Der n=1 Tax=Egicoccus sp. AB-alg2 TaxID=3242693 RepID=UPI00359DE72F